MPNQTRPELEKQILDMTAQFPTYSYIRIADQLRLVGIGVSAPAVRGVWVRHGITLRLQRLLWLDKNTASEGGVLTEQAKRLPQKHAGRNGDPEQHIEAPHSGYLLCQDTYFLAPSKVPARSTCRRSSMPIARKSLPSSISARCRSPQPIR
ncbi:MAG: hypothetical protein K7J46_15835 [Bryobacter sp.]|nr:hypothetical protein [Bryobacter sp. CoA8 C33]